MVRELEAAGAEVTLLRSNAVAPILQILRLADYLRRTRVTLVHCHLPVSGVAARLAAGMAKVPVIYTEHNLQESYHPLVRRLNRATWRLQRQVVAVSESVARSIEANIGRSRLVTVIPNGVDLDRFTPAPELALPTRRALGFDPDALVVGTVARFRRQKRLDDWLRAAAELRRRWPGARFLLVGEGPLSAELEALAGKLGLAGAVRFAGLQEDVRPYLAAMDVFLQASEFEGFPVAILEAMAMARPVVATSVGGVPEALSSETVGCLVEPRDPAALVDAVSALLADEGRRRDIGRAAREHVSRHYSVKVMQIRLEDLYEQVLANGSS
jgi:glycosyltransferase involved in cell wall biosynthesis